jgi:hypothetical protein
MGYSQLPDGIIEPVGPHGIGLSLRQEYYGFDPLGRLWSVGGAVFGPGLAQAYAGRFAMDANLTREFDVPLGFPYYEAWGMPNNASHVFSLYSYCLIVDAWGDFDGDGVRNRVEICSGTNPCDPASTPGTLAGTSLTIGQTTTLGLSSPLDAGLPYVTLASLGLPIHPLGDGRIVAPSFLSDPFALAWINAPPQWVAGAMGTLDAAGDASLSVTLPPAAALAGTSLWFSYLTLDPAWSSDVRTIFGPISLSLCAPSAPCP